MRLILLDLLFIVLNAADLALAFNVLYDNAAGCLTDNNSDDVPLPQSLFSGTEARRYFR